MARTRLDLVVLFAALVAPASISGCSSELGAAGDDDDLGRTDGYLTFAEFVDMAIYEPDSGIWIVDGDTPVTTWKGLHDIYEQIEQPGRLIVDRSGGRDSAWTEERRRDLTYCVSTSFGSRYDAAVRGMRDAAAAWEAVADVKFRHVVAEDTRCNASNASVLFDVRPTSGSGYLARAFFPNNGRQYRNVIVDATCWSTRAPLTCMGVLRHELGHTLGFRHEHTRPEAGRCYEDSYWRPLTPYDRTSVMHYPQCGGYNPELALSAQDIVGVRALYGSATGGTPPPSPPPPLPGVDRTESHDGALARNERRAFGPYDVVGGSTFRAVTTGTGDPDLYVRVGAAPTESEYDCRSAGEAGDETCELTVPAAGGRIYVEVRGYTDATFRLSVSWRTTSAAPPPPPDPGVPPPSGDVATERRGRATGSLRRGALQFFAPIAVATGSSFSVDVSGTGDPDLYVRWNDAPTVERFDCRSATRASSTERCEVVVPATATSARIMVHAWAESSFTLGARWTGR